MVMDTKVTAVCTLNCTIMMENKLQILTISIHSKITENGAVKICSSTRFHAFPHIQLVNTDTLIF